MRKTELWFAWRPPSARDKARAILYSLLLHALLIGLIALGLLTVDPLRETKAEQASKPDDGGLAKFFGVNERILNDEHEKLLAALCVRDPIEPSKRMVRALERDDQERDSRIRVRLSPPGVDLSSPSAREYPLRHFGFVPTDRPPCQGYLGAELTFAD